MDGAEGAELGGENGLEAGDACGEEGMEGLVFSVVEEGAVVGMVVDFVVGSMAMVMVSAGFIHVVGIYVPVVVFSTIILCMMDEVYVI